MNKFVWEEKMENKLADLLDEISDNINGYFTAQCFITDKTEIEIFNQKPKIEILRHYYK